AVPALDADALPALEPVGVPRQRILASLADDAVPDLEPAAPHPRFDRSGGADVERGSVRDGDERRRTVELERLAVLPRRPRRGGDRAGVAVSGDVGRGPAGTFAEWVERRRRRHVVADDRDGCAAGRADLV